METRKYLAVMYCGTEYVFSIERETEKAWYLRRAGTASEWKMWFPKSGFQSYKIINIQFLKGNASEPEFLDANEVFKNSSVYVEIKSWLLKKIDDTQFSFLFGA